jgi:hypothetical protein
MCLYPSQTFSIASRGMGRGDARWEAGTYGPSSRMLGRFARHRGLVLGFDGALGRVVVVDLPEQRRVAG